MSESVTGGLPFGDIPADTEMFTAEQTVSKIASLQAILSGITEEGWSGLDNIISGIDSITATFATKSGVTEAISERVVPYSGELFLASGVYSGSGVSGVYYKKNIGSGSGTASVRLLDEMLVSGGASRIQEAVFYAGGLSDTGMSATDLVTHAKEGWDAHEALETLRIVKPFSCGGGPGAAWDPVSGFISGLLSGASGGSGGGGSGGTSPAFIPPGFWGGNDPQPGDTFCDLVSGCIGDEYVKSDELCDLVSGCISSYESWGQIAQAISGLTATVCGLGLRLSGLVDNLTDTMVDSIMSLACDRVLGNPDASPDQKNNANKIKGVLADPDKSQQALDQAVDDGKASVKRDLKNDDPEVPTIKDDLDAINNALDNDHPTPAGEQPDDLSEALDPDGSGTDASAEVQPSIDEATETIDDEKEFVDQLWGEL